MLRDAEVGGRRVDVRVEAGRVVAVGPGLDGRPGDVEVDVGGGAVVPGLHDHHIHLLALAAAWESVRVGPPEVTDERAFVAALRDADARLPAGEWIRAVGYHESVAGPLDRWKLDAVVPGRPVRVQHRSGALWVLSSAGIRAAGVDTAADVTGVERGDGGEPTGRLWRLDTWLRTRLPSRPPDLRPVGDYLLRRGVTGVTDATPTEDPADVELLAQAVASGALPQRVMMTGSPRLDPAARAKMSPTPDVSRARAGAAPDEGTGSGRALGRASPAPCAAQAAAGGPDDDQTASTHERRTTATSALGHHDHAAAGPGSAAFVAPDGGGRAGAGGVVVPLLELGPVKLLLPDHELPPLDEIEADVRRARVQGRAVAVHCVTREALALTLAALCEIGTVPGDRIEHGAVIGLDAADQLAALGLTVVTNPGFVAERGDRYLAEVDDRDLPDLWRCRSLLDHGVAMAAGTDAPFGRPDPWAAIAAATERRTSEGARLGPGEALPAARALQLFLTPLEQPGGPPRKVEPGAPADLCILRTPLAEALTDPRSVEVTSVVVHGALHTWC